MTLSPLFPYTSYQTIHLSVLKEKTNTGNTFSLFPQMSNETCDGNLRQQQQTASVVKCSLSVSYDIEEVPGAGWGGEVWAGRGRWN